MMMPFILLLALAVSPQEADKQVRETLGALEKALAAPDESLADRFFDLNRLVKEMEKRGTVPDDNYDRYRWRSARRLDQHLAGMAAAPGVLRGGWEKIQPLSVRFNPTGDEAETLCRVTIGGKKCNFRFWLNRYGDGWRAYDFENLDGSFRLSVIGLQHTPGVRDDEDRYALRDGVMTFQRGAIYMAEGKPEAAREALATARRAAPPEYVMAWIDLVDGQALSALGEPEAALKATTRILARQKDFAGAYRLKAECHLALGDPVTAIASASDYLKLVGDVVDAWTLIGNAYERLDQPEKAIEAYRKAVDVDADDYRCRMKLGRLLVQRRQAPEGKAFLAEAARLAPVEEKVFEAAADLLDQEGAHAEALAISDDAATRRPDDGAVLFRRGRALRRLGRFRQAEEALRQAAVVEPEDKDIRTELVFVLAQGGRDAQAQEQIRTAIKEVPDGLHAYVRAFVHAAAGRSAQTLEELKPVLQEEERLQSILAWIESEPVFENIRSTPEGRALLDPARATRDYGKAREDPKLSPEEMLRTAAERIKAVPGYAPAYADQGHALRRLQRHAEAEQATRKAIELSADKTLFQDGLGRALASQGKLEDALAVADFLLKEKPKAEFMGLDLRAAVYALAGKRDLALTSLQHLLEKYPAWHSRVTPGAELDEFRKLPAVQDLIRKARARTRK